MSQQIKGNSPAPERRNTPPPLDEDPQSLTLSEWVEDRALSMLTLVGYGLLGFALVDYLDILVPPRFMNPSWEYEAIGRLVSKAWAPIFGLMLVFCRRSGSMGKRELNLLNCLSWGALLLGVIYFLLVPFSISNAFRLDQRTTSQIESRLLQQTSRMGRIRSAVDGAEGSTELQSLLNQAANRPIPPIDDPQAVKEDIIAQINQAEQAANSSAESSKKIRQRTLLKETTTRSLTCLLAGWLLVQIWRLSSWARNWRRFS